MSPGKVFNWQPQNKQTADGWDNKVRISRVYLPQRLATGESIQVSDEPAHYILTVLRLKRGYSLIVFNGEGGEYKARISDLGPKKSLTLVIGEHSPQDTESPLQTTLGLGITRGERMDYAVQKAVELGVTRITPLLTEYCVIKYKTKQAERRHQHWQRIALHACEQCGRTTIPPVDLPVSLSDWLASLSANNCRILFHPQQTRTLDQIELGNHQIHLLIGPEGGFSDTEVTRILENGFATASIGPRVLRAETAVVSALTLLQHHWGDI